MPYRLRTAALALVSATGIVLAGCSASGTVQPTTPTNVDPQATEQHEAVGAIFRQTAGVPFLVAGNESAGKYGLALKPSYIESSAASIAQLVAGDVQFAYSAYFGVIDAAQSGVQLRIIAEQITSIPGVQTLETLPNSGIKKLADLKGKKVAIPALNTTTDAKLKFDLASKGIDQNSVKFVELPFGEVGAALQNGTIDAGVLLGSQRAQAKDALGTVSVYDFGSNDWEGFAEGGWIVTQDYLTKNPNTVAAFQCAIVAGTKTTIEDDKAYTEQLKALGFSDAAITATVKPGFTSGVRNGVLQKVVDAKAAIAPVTSTFDINALVVPQPDNC